MKYVLIFSLAFIQSLSSYSQDVQKHVDELDHLVSLVPRHVGSKEYCDKLIRDLDDLSDDIEEELKDDDDIGVDDVKVLKATQKYAEAMEDFVRTVGNSSFGTGFLKEAQLRLVRDLLNFSTTEIYAGKFCVEIYKVSIGTYQSLIVTKSGGSGIVRIKATIKSGKGNATTTLELGVLPDEYSRFWTHANDPSYTSYQITRVECSAGSNSGFNF